MANGKETPTGLSILTPEEYAREGGIPAPVPYFPQEPQVPVSLAKPYSQLSKYDRTYGKHTNRAAYEDARNEKLAEVALYQKQKESQAEYPDAVDAWGRFDPEKLKNLKRRDELVDRLMEGSLSGRPSPLEHLFKDEINTRAQKVFGRDDLTVTSDGQRDSKFAQVEKVYDTLLSNPAMSPEGKMDDIAILSAGDTAVGDTLERVRTGEIARMGADLAAISRDMGRPGVTQSDREEYRRQFEERWPQYAAAGWKPGPMTSEQYAKLEAKINLNKANNNYKAIMSDGMPDEVATLNEKGQVELAPFIRESLSIRNGQKVEEHRADMAEKAFQADLLKFQRTQLRAEAPKELAGPDKVDPEKVAEYKRETTRVNELSAALWAKALKQEPKFSSSYSLHAAITEGIISPGEVVTWKNGKRAKIGPAPSYIPEFLDD